jgi:hypothetical protein
MSVKFGVLIMPESVAGAAELARLAEDSGFDRVRLGDSQSVYRELYVCLGLAAAATSRVRIGPGVTNPITRHPVVTASAIASVDELSHGRAFLGIGAGDSAVYNLGMKGASVATLADAVTAIRELLIRGQTIVLAVRRQPGTNTVAVVDGVRRLLPELRIQIPAAVGMDIVYDRSLTIRESARDVQLTLLLAIGLVVLVIFLFLRNVSATAMPAVAVPLSLVGPSGHVGARL